MKFVGRSIRQGIRQVNRMTREHALLLAFAGAAILFFSVLSSFTKPTAFSWRDTSWGNTSDRNEAAIDAALQDAAKAALGNREGTIIVMDTQTGRVRAIVNPQQAYTQALMPGSAIKPFTALAALRTGLIDENSRTVCPGRFTGLSFSLPCVHSDHLPPFSPSQAIAYSCNYYFASAGRRLGRDNLVATLGEFDFGQATGVSGEEASGVLRPCEIGNSARVRTSALSIAADQADCRERSAVGESDHIQVTPIQLLTAYAALINGGHLFEPRVATSDHFQPVVRSNINIASQHRAIIVEGMRGAVRYGTARAAKLDSLPLTIIGKTGTAMPATGIRNNGWFVGFAAAFQSSGELDGAQFNLAVLVLLSRAHGSEAAGVARPIFETYANLANQQVAEAQRISNSDVQTSDEKSGKTPRFPDAASAIKVHLVRDNVTQTLSLEDYVVGVMRGEATVETEPEASKALAIAIRTYALKNSGRHATDGYDFCSTTHCQRFVARDATVNATSNTMVDSRIATAARATEGQVVLDNRGQPIDAYFSASCGGETANIRDLWGVTPAFYLRGVRDEYCDTGPHAKWTDTISRADLLRALQSDSRTDVGNRLDHVRISTRDETGRAEFIAIEGEHRKTIRGWDFKIIVGRALGWNLLKSSRFEVSNSGTNFIFRGSGFGHGLGLCQEGAHVMATRGASYQKILEKYFPGTIVKRNVTKADILLSTSGLRYSLNTRPTTNSRFLTISSDNFRLAYPQDVDRRTVNQILNTLELTRTDYLRRVSAASTAVNIPRLEIRLNASTGDFIARTGQPWWAAAATEGNRIELQPASVLKQRGVLYTTLRHELAHILIDSVSNKRAPRWLQEGFALYLAGEGQMISRYVTRDRLRENELEQRLQHPRTHVEMRMLYAEAYLMVAEMIRRQGESRVWIKLTGY